MKLAPVDCKYGAPFGRPNQPHENSGYRAIPDMPHKFNLGIVRLDSGGYDNGGAYWGQRRRGEQLYYAVNETSTIERWFDATSRNDAKRIIRDEFPNARFYR